MSASTRRLNPTITQIMWLGSRQQLQKVDANDISILAIKVQVITSRDLGIMIDSQLLLEAHDSAVRRSGYHQLRQLRPVIKSVPQEAFKMLVYAFISSHLQFVVVQHHRRATAKIAVSPKCGSTSCNRSTEA